MKISEKMSQIISEPVEKTIKIGILTQFRELNGHISALEYLYKIFTNKDEEKHLSTTDLEGMYKSIKEVYLPGLVFYYNLFFNEPIDPKMQSMSDKLNIIPRETIQEVLTEIEKANPNQSLKNFQNRAITIWNNYLQSNIG